MNITKRKKRIILVKTINNYLNSINRPISLTDSILLSKQILNNLENEKL
jgi:hypothetical protein